MKSTIDTDVKSVEVERFNEHKVIPLYSKDGFELISELWMKVGMNEKKSAHFHVDGAAYHTVSNGHVSNSRSFVHDHTRCNSRDGHSTRRIIDLLCPLM
jgi:hypothetical protein